MMFRMEAKRSVMGIAGNDEIFVRSLNGKTTTANVESHQSIHNLKDDIYLTGGTPPEYNTLLLNG